MTEPDEALLWAREDYARHRLERGHTDSKYEAEIIRLGALDLWTSVSVRAEAYRAGQAASAERIKVLEEALAKANKPRWFYADDEGSPFDSVYAAVEAILDEFGPEDAFPNGKGVQRIDTMRDCAPTYAAVRILTEAEREARDDGFVFEVTECATEAEAIAALKEADQ